MPSKKKSSKGKRKTKGRPAKKKSATASKNTIRSRRTLKAAPGKKAAGKPAKKAAKEQTTPKGPVLRRSARKRASVSPEREISQDFQNRNLSSGRASGGESGDLQGLSRREQADSESVDELIEEGNAFEADAVAGVEEADDSEEREVHTHEVPEDDVPEEYLDKD